MDSHHAAAVLIRKLESITELTDDERAALHRLPYQIKNVAADQDLVSDGERPSQCCLILEGFSCRYKVTPDGKRQILSFHIAGDIPDLQSLHLKVMDHALGLLTPGKVAFISHESLFDLCNRHPNVAGAFWRDTLIDAAVFREWITNIGRRSAYQRTAHLLCEVSVRLRAVGLAEGNAFPFPVTQAEIADATGLSNVHVNRTLQELRAAGLIDMRDGRVTVRNWNGLQEAGEFDPTYLHIKHPKAA